MMTTP